MSHYQVAKCLSAWSLTVGFEDARAIPGRSIPCLVPIGRNIPLNEGIESCNYLNYPGYSVQSVQLVGEFFQVPDNAPDVIAPVDDP